MAEDKECFKIKKIGEQKESVTSIGNSWIICRSQSHSGRIYYFNTLTGKSAWNLSDGEIEKAKLLSREATSLTHVGDCPEPVEPPVDAPHCSSHQHVQPKDAGARIYNKQIINNQFSKPYPIPAFQNNQCPCSSLNTGNDTNLNVAPAYNPAMWVIPPPHQVFLASAAAAAVLANQAQSPFNTTNVQNNSVPNYYQMEQNSPHFQRFHSTNRYPARWNQNSQRNYQSTSNKDLRDILSARRKDQRSHIEEPEQRESYESRGNNLPTSDGLDPSDIDDEWLEANTNGDISRVWRECSGADRWIVVANAHVMLNNRKFLSRFIKPDEQIYFLTPLEILKQLRSATGDTESGSRLVQRARCALRFAAQQMDKVPAGLKNLQNRTVEKCCLELIEQNYNVLLILDDNELSSHINIDGVSTFTISKLKEYLNQKFNTWKLGTHENITVTFCQKSGGNINQSTQEAPTTYSEYKSESTSIEHKEIEIQTEQITPVKTTVDACIQTDFDVSQSALILQSPISEVSKSPIVVQPLNTGINKSPSLGDSSQIDQALKKDVVIETSNDVNKEEPKVATKKIRLNRQTSNASTGDSHVKKSQFRWRKQRAKPSITTTPPSKDAVVSNNQTLSSKSPPSSLISISDLLPPQNDNFSDLAKSITFSDVSIEKPHEVVNKVIDESSLDVISNSLDETIPEISKNAIFNESKYPGKEDIVMFEVTSDLMDDYLTRGCDEWLSRFVQIMEEALSQILQQEPCFSDPSMPPPWSVYEATVCIKRKFMDFSKIVFACNECGTFLLTISDSRGKIFADLNPSDFMRLYSYGVYLIEALQSLLNESEDLQIARDSLCKLLDDIKNPNLDAGQNVFIDTFLTDKQDYMPNVSELDTDARDGLVDANGISPPKKPKQTSQCEPSPSRFKLRSSQRSNELSENELPEIQNTDQNTNTDASFFSGLRQQKTSSSTDFRLPFDARPFSPQETSLPNNSSGEDKKQTDTKGPKIIRNFNFDQEIEKKLMKSNPIISSNGSNAYDFEYDDYADDNNYYGNEFIIEDNYYNNSDDKSVSNTHNETKSDEIGAQILKFVIERTTYPVHRVLEDLHSFCEDTSKELSSPGKIDQLYKTNLIEKTTEVRESLNNLCTRLNSVLCRNDTKKKVRVMLEELGFMSCEINDTQVAEYEGLVQKYLDQATILFESVNFIAAAIREKE